MTQKISAGQLVSLGLEESAARNLADRVNELIASLPVPECWQKVSKEILTPDHPFAVHRFLYDTIFAEWDETQGPRPAWSPTSESIETTNIHAMMKELDLKSYEKFHAWSVGNRGEFWDMMIRRLGIRFKKEYMQSVDLSDGVEFPKWLPGARLNIADSCFAAPGSSPAIVYRREDGDELSTMTYAELDSFSNRIANGLAAARYVPGDAIACYMPMTAECVAIYLGIVKAGCVVVSIADSFAADELEKRLRLSSAKGIFTQDFVMHGGKQIPLYEKVVSADGPAAVVLPAGDSIGVKLRKADTGWDDFLSDDDRFSSVLRDGQDHMNILFSSGTTGDPKTIPWTQTTPIKCAVDGYLHHDIRPGDVVAWPSNIGWMMGPWLIYASLINQATMALFYETPTGRAFTEFVRDARVNMLGLVPSMVRAWRVGECTKGIDWSAIRAFSSTGECSNMEDYLFLMSAAEYKPVIEYCGGTEIGGGYITGTVVQSASPATFSTPALGVDLLLMDDRGRETDNGEVFLVPPSIGLSTELINKDHHEVYFEGVPTGPHGEVLRRHGDQIERLGGGYYRAHGRADDTMNLSGIKVSSAEIERVLKSTEGVSETAAIAVSSPSKLVVYAVPEPGADTDKEELKSVMQGKIKKHLNPLFRLHEVVIVDSLPRTASNKVMHRMLRAEYEKVVG